MASQAIFAVKSCMCLHLRREAHKMDKRFAGLRAIEHTQSYLLEGLADEQGRIYAVRLNEMSGNSLVSDLRLLAN